MNDTITDTVMGTGTVNSRGTVITFALECGSNTEAAETFMLWTARTADVYCIVRAAKDGAHFGVECYIPMGEHVKLPEVTR